MRIRVTDHARDRAHEMGLTTKAVKRALREPELIYPSRVYPHCEMARRDGLVVPFETKPDGTRVAITVLWWSPQHPIEREDTPCPKD